MITVTALKWVPPFARGQVRATRSERLLPVSEGDHARAVT